MREKNRFRVRAGRLILTFCCFAAAVIGCVALMDMLAREPSLTVVESPSMEASAINVTILSQTKPHYRLKT